MPFANASPGMQDTLPSTSMHGIASPNFGISDAYVDTGQIFYFLLDLLTRPWVWVYAASIPVFSTRPALILVGALMMINVVKIPWEDILHAVPAFLTIVLMPLTYSIAYGGSLQSLGFGPNPEPP